MTNHTHFFDNKTQIPTSLMYSPEKKMFVFLSAMKNFLPQRTRNFGVQGTESGVDGGGFLLQYRDK
jgi:hypothetical protein